MRNIKLTISYDGTNYCGWQRQKNGKSVQEEIERVLNILTKERITIYGSGRTDAGVHALGQVANFISNTTIPIDKVPTAMNSILPEDIIIVRAEEVDLDFHARYNAKGKKYRYVVYNREIKNPFYRNYSYHVPYPLDLELMREGAKYFLGEHDFRAFMASGSSVKNTVRNIYSIEIKREGDFILFDFSGNGFLYNMVRIMTGTLVDVGRGFLEACKLPEIILSKERVNTGHTAPPQGLYLMEVFY